ncbi:MAG TPA: ATP-grasp peptide maturase system methyltransferase [Mycobacteriales bacterium]|nr:ATP-grasp peptide maturase system methyltransferase [Mycobacteriales bacterium]
MTRSDRLRAELVAELTGKGWLQSAGWGDAFGTVARERFLRQFFALTPDRSRYEAVDEHRPDWLDMVYRNAVWPTQLDGDDTRWDQARRSGPIIGTPTCSSTQPSLMAVMLDALDVRDGHRVLEIGTGTGYNAALLTHRLGGEQVVSVDVDAGLVERARDDLARAGYRPVLVAADGTGGYPDGEPYDRLIATCAVPAIPQAWLAQVRSGGVVLANINRQLVGGSLVRLRVHPDGSASGRLLDDYGGFMPVRAHQDTDLWDLVKAASGQHGEQRKSRLPAPVRDEGEGWTVLADLLMTGVARTDLIREDGDVQWLVHPDGSWAYYQAATGCVEQGGSRRLWDELEYLHDLWVAQGRPRRDDIGLTVGRDGAHQVWLHDPTNVVAP